MERKHYSILGTMALALISIGYLMLPTQLSTGNTFVDKMKPAGTICYQTEKLNPKDDISSCIHNTVTNIAKNQTRDARSGNAGTAAVVWQSLLLSSGATAAAAADATCEATVFTTNGCAAANGTTSITGLSIGNYSVTNKFSATGACAAIAKVCLSNDTQSTSPLMASGLLTTAITLAANENLTIVYYMGET